MIVLNLPRTTADFEVSARAGGASGLGNSAAGTCGVVVLDGTGRLDLAAVARLEGWIVRLIHHLGLRGECRVRLAGDEETARMHGERLGEARPTDVLTFDLSETRGVLDADILICLDEAERAAAEADTPLEHELLLYVLHGLLHCMGHDDKDEASSRAMHEKEDEILSALGIGPVYHRGDAGGRTRP